MKTALITGILGQDGPFLAKQLLEKDYKVYGLIRRYSNPNFSNPIDLDVHDKIEYVSGDITDALSMSNIIKGTRPDLIFNMAAQSHVHESWEQPMYTVQTTGAAVLNILEAMRTWVPFSRMYQASSSEMYGSMGEQGIQDENTPFHPRSPYACAKVFAHFLTINYRESYNMFCSTGILLNHESYIRGKAFVTRKITDNVARIKLGLKKEFSLGNMDAQRDWGHAPDYMEAAIKILEHNEPDDFTICTGETHTVREFVTLAFQHAGIYDWEPYVKIDPRFIRPAEVNRLIGSYAKAKEKLGWEPLTSFQDLVRIMVDADVERVRKEKNA